MTTGKRDDFVSSYSPLPSNPNPNPNFDSYSHPSQKNSYSHPLPENVVVGLPSYYPIHRRNNRRNWIIPATVLLFLAAAIFFLYPSDPELHLARIQLNHISIKANPKPILDLSFSLKLKVRNRDFFSVVYDSIDVSLGYRGREIGTVSSAGGGRIRARGSDYIDVVLSIDAFEVIYDTFYLIEDMVKGVIVFDTVSKVDGKLGFLPLKATVSCEVFVNIYQQTIVRQNCYPKSLGDTMDRNATISAIEMGDMMDRNANISVIGMGDMMDRNANISAIEMGDVMDLNANISAIRMGDMMDHNANISAIET